MKYYKDDQSTVYAYAADGSDDDYIQDGLVAIDAAEADALRFPRPTLAQAKEQAYNYIDAKAGEVRKKYITDVPGQAETYLLKSSDAKVYKTAGYPYAQISDYPMVEAEAMALYGSTPTADQTKSATDIILSTQSQWVMLAANIERVRRSGKEAVQKASNIAEIDTAKQVAIADLSLL